MRARGFDARAAVTALAGRATLAACAAVTNLAALATIAAVATGLAGENLA